MNLLPTTHKDLLKKGLKSRFTIIVMFLFSISFLIGTIMLLPSYILILSGFTEIKSDESSSKIDNENLTKEIIGLPEKIDFKLNFLEQNSNTVSLIDVLSEIVKDVPSNISVNSFSISKNQVYKEKTGTLIIASGMASDRTALVSFSNMLKKSKSFSIVDVPVSSLTKERNLPFSLNILIEN